MNLPFRFRWIVAREVRLKLPRFFVILNTKLHRRAAENTKH